MVRARRIQPHGELLAIDRVDPVEVLRDGARLVALQGADEMPFELEMGKRRDFFNGFLHVALSESRLTGAGGVFDI
jgi:hypothetical protein